MATSRSRPLEGLSVGLSISRSGESQALGFPDDAVNRVTFFLVEGLLATGVQVVLGHDWRPGGVMYSVLDAAREYATSTARSGEPILVNVLPWPHRTAMLSAERGRWKGILDVRELEAPAGFGPRRPGQNLTAQESEAAMGSLREELTRITHARICVGGKTQGFSGSMPGILQEAGMALGREHPIYATRMLGGASSWVLDALDGEPWPDRFEPRLRDGDAEVGEHRVRETRAAWNRLSEIGRERAREQTCLDDDEFQQLAEARNVPVLLRLVLRGLGRVHG